MFPCQDTPSVKVTYNAEVCIILEMVQLANCKNMLVEEAACKTTACLNSVAKVIVFFESFLACYVFISKSDS